MNESEKINRELQKISEELYCKYYETCYRDEFLIYKLDKSINRGIARGMSGLNDL